MRVNTAYAAVLGVGCDELMGRRIGEVSPVGVEVERRWREVLEDGRWSGAVRLTRQDGEERWLEFLGVAEVVPGHHLLIVRDVTELRRAEEGRARSSRQATFLRDLAIVLAEAPDFGGAMHRMLREVCSFMGLQVGEFWIPEQGEKRLERASAWAAPGYEGFTRAGESEGTEWDRGVLGRARESTRPEIGRAASDLGPVRGAAAVDAGLRSAVAVPILSDGSVAGILLLVGSQQITESRESLGLLTGVAAQLGAALQRKRAEEAALRESAIVQEARVAIVGKALDGTILTWNRGARDMYGYDAQEVIGRPISILLPPDRPDEVAVILERLGRGELVDSFETERVRKDGRRVRVDLTVSPVRDALGRIVGASAIARDITRQRHLEDELRQAQKMESLGRLAGGVAHDFNNLLTVIMGEVDAAVGLVEDESVNRGLEEVRRAAERAATLTRQLLSFARRQVPEARVVDLNDIIGDLSGMLRRVLGERVELVILPERELWPVKVDPGHVEQVLVNLAVNARDAMPEGGRLSVQTENVSLGEAYVDDHVTVAAGDYVRISVTDTGAGMSHETMTHVFEPFFTTKGDRGGTGLGLSTCYGIIQQAGGHIWAYSEVGEGTTFKIYLPRTGGNAAQDQPQDGAPEGGGETILFVEDEPGVRAVGVRALRRFGYQVLEANNGADALRLAQIHPGRIDLLITDVVMPVMGGKELADRLVERLPELRVLFTSGYTQDEMLRRGFPTGLRTFFAKPFVPGELARRVRDVLDQEA